MSTKQAPRPQVQPWRPLDTLGARLVLIRRQLNISQRKAAELTGLTFGEWQGLEDDSRGVRRVDQKVSTISRVFNVDREWLMWGGAPWSEDQVAEWSSATGRRLSATELMQYRPWLTESGSVAA